METDPSASGEGIERERQLRAGIEDWLVSLRERYAEHSVVNRYKGLRAFMKWLIEEEEIERDPMRNMRPPAADEKHKQALSADAVGAVLAMPERGKRWRDAVVVAVLYDTGMRVSELCGIQTGDIDLDSGLIVLTTTKARRPRVVRVSPRGITCIDRYLRRRKGASEWLILGMKGPMTPSGIRRLVQRVFRETGIEGVYPHLLRHTAASHMVGHMEERDLSRLFGWSSPKMARHYAESALTEVALKAHEKASPLTRLGR